MSISNLPHPPEGEEIFSSDSLKNASIHQKNCFFFLSIKWKTNPPPVPPPKDFVLFWEKENLIKTKTDWKQGCLKGIWEEKLYLRMIFWAFIFWPFIILQFNILTVYCFSFNIPVKFVSIELIAKHLPPPLPGKFLWAAPGNLEAIKTLRGHIRGQGPSISKIQNRCVEHHKIYLSAELWRPRSSGSIKTSLRSCWRLGTSDSKYSKASW